MAKKKISPEQEETTAVETADTVVTEIVDAAESGKSSVDADPEGKLYEKVSEELQSRGYDEKSVDPKKPRAKKDVADASSEPAKAEKKTRTKKPKAKSKDAPAPKTDDGKAEAEGDAEPKQRGSISAHREYKEESRKRAVQQTAYNTEKETRFTLVASLMNAKKAQHVLSGVVAAAEPLEFNGARKIGAIVFYKDIVKVTITFDKMYDGGELARAEGETDESILRRQEQILNTHVGANIDFMVDDVFVDDSGNIEVFGNRRRALKRLQALNYYPLKGRDEPFVKVGGVYDAAVVGVGVHGIRANIRGVDTQIWISNLTYRFVDDAHKLFAPGQTLRVRVREITKDPETGRLSVNASAKDTEYETLRPNLDRIRVGATCAARITYIVHVQRDGNDRYIANLFIEHYNVPAVCMTIKTDGLRRPLRQGDLVSFRVERIDRVAIGSILRIIEDRESFLVREFA